MRVKIVRPRGRVHVELIEMKRIRESMYVCVCVKCEKCAHV